MILDSLGLPELILMALTVSLLSSLVVTIYLKNITDKIPNGK